MELNNAEHGYDAMNPAEQDEMMELEIDLLLEGLYRRYGYDFRHYARSSIKRRLIYRMNREKVPSMTALLERILFDPQAAERLLQDLSIRVTEMFRDPSFFLALRQRIIPKLRTLPEIRIWHAGCSTGEEPISMAILLEEEGLGDKVKIYATDMNEEALRVARKGAYRLSSMQNYTKNYLQAGGTMEFSKYYTTTESEAIFDRELMQRILFFQHNLVMDRSFNEFHLIICRNVMIYFDERLQQEVLHLFYESLSIGGFLGLGSNESMLYAEEGNKYRTIDASEKWYQKLR
ncbi:CheR family methyltransferase [Paenibacillus aquistagni]|uniref:Chemotaxis protein methyltransferase CheR n=1 Tax=Paenibacillus aquistagni TaxID=1852522 RepID=A0A1X7KT75_9BACL|nr:protein-glutamate O-methyltransferase CheR [Paenibacillus aquistagni]SMG44044.1 chemotaxis protein methyltransferase CheR [Paenibacillus aquistagni]